MKKDLKDCCSGEQKKVSCCEHKDEIKKSECHCKEENGETHSCCEGEKVETHSCCSEKMTNKKAKQDCRQTEEKQTYSSCCSSQPKSGGCCNEKINGKRARIVKLVFLAVSFASLIVSFIAPFAKSNSIMKYLDFGWIAVILCGYPIFISAFKNISKGKVTSSLLISVAIIASIALEIVRLSGGMGHDAHGHSYIFAAGEIAWLMAVGGMIEDFTVGKARAGIERLIKLAPTTAKYRVDGEIVEKPITEVKLGDIVVVLPNDMISVDGEIVLGATAVDEAVMTGESIPSDKGVGDKVFGGTWNKSGAIEVKVTKIAEDMAIAKMRKLVEEAEGRKAPISKIADKWASYIVPAAMALSVLVFLFSYFVLKANLVSAIIRGVTMLVVFCPCSLALATPTAVAAGLGNGTKKGMLIKSGAALESLARINVVAFDKTGTLTEGNIVVDEVIAYKVDRAYLLNLAGAAEKLSEHPIAKAVTKYCGKTAEAQYTKSLMGVGVEAKVGESIVIVCKWSNLADAKVSTELAIADAERFLSEGKTVIAVVENNILVGIFALSDEVRAGAKECIDELEQMKIKTVMLTGDNSAVAGAIAAKVGIDEVYASLMPQQKLDRIESIKAEGKKVCMVGDGVNDAPALAISDCSIAMGALGSDAAIETADVALLNSDIKRVPTLLRLAKRVLTTIKGNIILSMSINLVAVVLSTLGILDPVTGALVHNISSILVVLNSAMILRFREGKKKAQSLLK